MAGFSVAQGSPRWQDTGQGAAGRLASWSAWTADPTPLFGPETTRIFRTDDNGVLAGDPPVPLGTGGCGAWEPFLDGAANYPTGDGAVSGGQGCFYSNV